MDFEDILLDVGDNGWYQKSLLIFFLIPTSILLPLFTMNIVFMVSIPDHWCNVPDVAASNLTIEQQKELIRPVTDDEYIHHCFRRDINFTDYLSLGNYTVPENTSKVACDDGWVYDTTYYDSTAATFWTMYCGNFHYKSLVMTMFSVGSIIGTPILGYSADKIGRKIIFFITLTINAVTAMGSVLVSDFTAFIVIKTINGCLMPSVYEIPFIIILELVAPELRTHMNGFSNCSWTVGLCILPLLAYLTRNWVTLGYVTSAITVIFCLYWPFIPESPRWLLSRGKYDEALAIIMKIAKKNGKKVDPEHLLTKLKALGEKDKKEKTVNGKSSESSSLDLLKYPQLRKIFLIVTFCWIADFISYYGLQYNVQNLAGNEFVNFFLTAVVELPGYVTSWILMDRIGRRWCSVGCFITTGIACLLPLGVSGLPYGDLVCSMLGKFSSSAAFMATYQQASELYPTVVRSSGIGMSSTIATAVSVGIPFLIGEGSHGKAWIPLLTIGLTCLIAGVLASFLPETINENLPQTVQDLEDFAKDKKYLSWQRRRISVSRERKASVAFQMKGSGNMEVYENSERC